MNGQTSGLGLKERIMKKRYGTSGSLFLWVVIGVGCFAAEVFSAAWQGVPGDDAAASSVAKRSGGDVGDTGDAKLRMIRAREAAFAEMMDKAVLKGSWQMTSGEGLVGKKPLSDPKPESYAIEGASKVIGDHWIITARIRFADKDVTIPVPVRVVWAGDTPVITVDSTKIPMLGEYSARVMVYRNFYAGTWFGKGYGGVLSGQIVKSPEAGKSLKDQRAKSSANQRAEEAPPKQ